MSPHYVKEKVVKQWKPMLHLFSLYRSVERSKEHFKVYRDQGRTSGRALFLLACSSKISPFSSIYVIPGNTSK